MLYKQRGGNGDGFQVLETSAGEVLHTTESSVTFTTNHFTDFTAVFVAAAAAVGAGAYCYSYSTQPRILGCVVQLGVSFIDIWLGRVNGTVPSLEEKAASTFDGACDKRTIDFAGEEIKLVLVANGDGTELQNEVCQFPKGNPGEYRYQVPPEVQSITLKIKTPADVSAASMVLERSTAAGSSSGGGGCSAVTLASVPSSPPPAAAAEDVVGVCENVSCPFSSSWHPAAGAVPRTDSNTTDEEEGALSNLPSDMQTWTRHNVATWLLHFAGINRDYAKVLHDESRMDGTCCLACNMLIFSDIAY